VLSSLFYRNKGAYLVGTIINGYTEVPFALAILHRTPGVLYVDAALFGEDDLLMLFSFSRAYFMTDMEIPSAYVQFLRSLMPRKPRSDLYNALGLGKQGKNLFYRDFLWHLRHSSDNFRVAPGIEGMVMLVFDLPSFPYVFKLIKDQEHFPPQKDTTREQIGDKYHLVVRHDRVGRMADTMEFSYVAFPHERFAPELLDKIRACAASQLEIHERESDGRPEVILRHLYIERRMIPLNLYLQEAFDAGPDDAVMQALIRASDDWERRCEMSAAYRETGRTSILFDTVAVYMAYTTRFLNMETMRLRIDDEGFTRRAAPGDADAFEAQVALTWSDLDAYLDCLVDRLLAPIVF
jgi:isocitrate dehydrogenase kinase/phosphatase